MSGLAYQNFCLVLLNPAANDEDPLPVQTERIEELPSGAASEQQGNELTAQQQWAQQITAASQQPQQQLLAQNPAQHQYSQPPPQQQASQPPVSCLVYFFISFSS